jgi:hypothetical protein
MDQQFEKAVADFVSSFELVFDNGWEFTQSVLQEPEQYISDGCTFIQPNVQDESNNWANRGHLLNWYRRLKVLLDASRG